MKERRLVDITSFLNEECITVFTSSNWTGDCEKYSDVVKQHEMFFLSEIKKARLEAEDVYLKTGLKILGSCNRVPEIPKLFTRLSMIKSA
jgi:hypothetical protein